MENNFVFRSLEVTGNTKEEALAKTPFNVPFERWTNATQAYNNWRDKQTGAITDAATREFMVNYLASKKISAAYIVKEAAVKDSRKRPYTVEKVKREGAARRGKVFQLIDNATNQILAETKVKLVPQVDKDGKKIVDEQGNTRMKVQSATMKEAEQMAKELITNGFKGNIRIDETRRAVEGDNTVMYVKYTPSTSAKVGVYDAFGYESC